MENTDYQLGFLTGYSGGYYTLYKQVFLTKFTIYPTSSIWQKAIAIQFITSN